MSSRRAHYSNKFKKQIFEFFQSQKSVSKEYLRVCHNQLGQTKKGLKNSLIIAEDCKSINPFEVKQLENRIKKLEMEIEFLENALAIF